jgi:hypothetical protein
MDENRNPGENEDPGAQLNRFRPSDENKRDRESREDG